MGKHRDKIDIVAKILNAARQNVGKTQIMYQANLNYDMLKKYLARITDYEFIFLDEKQHYQITEKGQGFLDTYRKYSKASKKKERQLRAITTKKKALEELFSDQIIIPPNEEF